MGHQLLMGQAAALAYPVYVKFSERKETVKNTEYAKCVPVEVCISRIFYWLS